MTCPTDEELLAFARGRLDPESRAEFEAHLDTCSTCLAGVAALAVSTLPSAERDDVAARAPRLAPGQPRYVLEGEIARGGMGRIFAAQDRLLGRRIAIKRVRTRGGAVSVRRLDAARGHATRGVALLEAQLAHADTPSVRQDLASLLVVLGDHDPGDGGRAYFERAAELLMPIRSRAGMTPTLAELCDQVDAGLKKTMK